MELNYPQFTTYCQIRQTAQQFPRLTAYDFMGNRASYQRFLSQIQQVAAALSKSGIQKGDRVALCLPNCPHGVIAFYAIGYLGAVACMIHPLSAPDEIGFYVNHSGSKLLITMDLFYQKVCQALTNAGSSCKVVVTTIGEQLPPMKRLLYPLTQNKGVRLPKSATRWREFLRVRSSVPTVQTDGNLPAALLYSGGTTGQPKGILLTHRNLNALALQTIHASGYATIHGDTMLSVMPMFHGFGLGIGIHTALVGGACCLLVPRFTVDSYAKLVKQKKPNFIPGVPTLFAALLQAKALQKANLSFLKGVFCGGDSLSPELKKRVDAFLKQRHSPVPIREGYGTTECVTASCLTPIDRPKEGSIGLPFADTFYKIVKPATQDVLPADHEGEICISGPTVMVGYWNDAEETRQILQVHNDGLTWLHTGDLGTMDAEGYVYFKQRLKRMIVTNGYNVYPTQIESALMQHPAITECCVIGVKDEVRGQRVRAYIVADKPTSPDELLAHCKKSVARYALPKEFVFRESLPKTAVGKVAYRTLEEESSHETETKPNH